MLVLTMKRSRPSYWTDLLLEFLAKGFDFFDQDLKSLKNLEVDAVGKWHRHHIFFKRR